MSKRYGRTQKRRHKEQIKKLQDDLEWFKKSRNEWLNLANKKQYGLERITQVIEDFNKLSVCLPPKLINGNSDIDSVRIPVYGHEFNTINAHLLRISIEENKQTFQLLIHLRYGNEKESIYCMSKESFYNLSPKIIAEEISKDIAIKLIKYLQA